MDPNPPNNFSSVSLTRDGSDVYVYDAAGQLLQVQRAYLTPLQQNYATYEYTLNGRQKAVIDADRNRAEMIYDGFDRQRRWIFPSPTPPAPGQAGAANPTDYEEYGYDAVGNRTSLRKRDGVTLTYQYDDLNRLRIKTVPQSATGAAGYSVYYGYDVRGLQAWARFGSDSGPGVWTQYDGFGRLRAAATSVDGTARTPTSTYDHELRITPLPPARAGSGRGARSCRSCRCRAWAGARGGSRSKPGSCIGRSGRRGKP